MAANTYDFSTLPFFSPLLSILPIHLTFLCGLFFWHYLTRCHGKGGQNKTNRIEPKAETKEAHEKRTTN